MIKAVIFDMDGLLIDTEPKWQEIERNFIEKIGLKATPEMMHPTLGLRTIEMIKYWYNRKPWPDPDFQAIEKEIEESMRNYYLTDGELMPGAMQILDFFKNKNIRTAIASSSPMVLIDTFLDKFNIASYFEVKYSAETEEFGKPHPGVYISTARKLSLHPSVCLAFEDSFNGLLAAKAALMKAVVIPEPELFSQPRYSIADLKLKSLTEFNQDEFNKLN